MSFEKKEKGIEGIRGGKGDRGPTEGSKLLIRDIRMTHLIKRWRWGRQV